MPNQIAQGLLSTIAAREAREKEAAAARSRAEAESWAQERVKKLTREVETVSLGFRIHLMDLVGEEPTEYEWRKISALNELLGIDLMRQGSGAEIRDLRYEATDPKDWRLSIGLGDFQKLLAAS
ncbi:hypothetical protein KBA73_02690 [Patescibacteria group bacterium]|nr:hypothetical protein [Patescibacteria group bacterium]